MQQTLSQLPLAQRIPALADGIRSLRAMKAQHDIEEKELLRLLRQAETELKGKPAGSEGVEIPADLLVDEPKPAPEHAPEHAHPKAKTK
jgi:hypothetical protein